MPATPHIEKHFLASAAVRDVVIGMADGLTVPFALAAGLSGAVSSTSIITTAGLAEVAAGAIAMGLGGYLAARTDLEHYRSEYRREQMEIDLVPETERAEVRKILREQGLDAALTETVTAALTRDRQRWLNFMMRFELIPLAPYFLSNAVSQALPLSIALTLTALCLFGGVKGQITGVPPLRSALQTAIIGALAGAAAYAIARMVGA
jgi:VIT1/CCC1 family predicted Fe2+/Mn2+ transporter